MNNELIFKNNRRFFSDLWKRVLILLAVFGPATITAMADNDAGGVATYSIAGAKLGYPILFLLPVITLLLAITQEMGMRLTVITRRGLADLIRERYGVRAAVLMFGILLIANVGTLVTELSAVKTTSSMFGISPIPAVIAIVIVAFVLITRGNYKVTQSIMLVACAFFLVYIFSAAKANPDWHLALTNLVYPHGVSFTRSYLKDYLIIGMGVLGTTITPWGQFFISSFAYDKKIEKGKVGLSQFETYWGAFLTDFFSFFMIVATAATLFVNHIVLDSGERAAMAIAPFAGKIASELFAIGILNAGFMGLVVVSLSTAYAFAEFFGLSGSLDDSFKESKTFYILYLAQLLAATLFVIFSSVSLFQIALVTQIINAIGLPLVFYFLIKLTSDRGLMGEFVNNVFQKNFAAISSVVIVLASVFTVLAVFFNL
ncbi:MAG TPA: divalent metal cation transporter [Anaerolineales bacterium]|nr:divalent metal cation transporter [Anaerolineales bacterium]